MIKFITGNIDKFAEVNAIVPNLEQLDIDLPEIQELDAQLIIREKLDAARKHHSGEFIVEDTSLYLDCLNGFPGPLIKWFKQDIGIDGIVDVCAKMGIDGARAKTIIGYAALDGEIHFFEHEISGKIVPERGTKDFGWGPIFMPNGQNQTFGEMDRELKQSLSMRSQAARKLVEFLKSSE